MRRHGAARPCATNAGRVDAAWRKVLGLVHSGHAAKEVPRSQLGARGCCTRCLNLAAPSFTIHLEWSKMHIRQAHADENVSPSVELVAPSNRATLRVYEAHNLVNHAIVARRSLPKTGCGSGSCVATLGRTRHTPTSGEREPGRRVAEALHCRGASCGHTVRGLP